MTARLLCIATLCAASLGSAFATAPATPPSPKLQQRIDALLKRRLKPEALPVTVANPFQANGGAIRSASAESGDASADANGVSALGADPTNAALAPTSSEILTTVASRMKIGGLIVLKDRLQAVINGSPRREGDLVAADWNGSLIYAKIARLSAGEIVLRYLDAEVTLKF